LLSQLIGALLRAIIVLLVVATPSLLLPGTTAEGAQMVMLIGLVLAVFTVVEYTASYPALIEFRDAPPFNRVRVLTLLVTLFCLSLVAGSSGSESSLVLILNALGLLVGKALDFTWSPMTVILGQIPEGTSIVTAMQVKIMVGLSVFIMLTALCIFVMLIRLHQWPSRDSAFNVWVNLPTFDPTTGGDVVARLLRDARVNLIFGFTLPFVLPVIGMLAANHVGLAVLGSPHTMVWGIALWMFLPLSMFMRGLAMARIAEMIRLRRARLSASVAADTPGATA